MAKGLVSQCATLLTNGEVGIDDVRRCLRQQHYDIVKETPAQEDWAFGGPTLIIPYLPEVNGYAAVDVVSQPWPDAMGDPKKDPITFGAWSMGHFGPFAYPGGLKRARQHARSAEVIQPVADRHRGFIRIRLSYVFDASDDSPVLPVDYDPVAEMMFLSRVVLALLDVPGVLCYFNPNGEVLYDQTVYRDFWDRCAGDQTPPIQLWTNTRHFCLNEELGFMDTVGNSQLDARDVEAIYPTSRHTPDDIDNYLRNVTIYLLDLQHEMHSGEPIDGPGESNLTWTLEVLDEGLAEPPRKVVRLYPKAIRNDVRKAVADVRQDSK